MTSRGWTFTRWLAIAALAWVLVVAVALSGCTPRPVVRPDPPVSHGCTLHAPPPVVHGVASTCDPKVCLSDDDAHRLAGEVRALQSWADESWGLCGARAEPAK